MTVYGTARAPTCSGDLGKGSHELPGINSSTDSRSRRNLFIDKLSVAICLIDFAYIAVARGGTCGPVEEYCLIFAT